MKPKTIGILVIGSGLLLIIFVLRPVLKTMSFLVTISCLILALSIPPIIIYLLPFIIGLLLIAYGLKLLRLSDRRN